MSKSQSRGRAAQQVNPPATQPKANLPATWIPPTLDTISVSVDLADFPPELDQLPGSTGQVDFEWKPQKENEIISGKVLKLNEMKLGGIAIVLLAEADYRMPNGATIPVLHKCGKVLTARLIETETEVGDRVVIVFKGEQEAKEEGMSPMKLYAFKNLSRFSGKPLATS